MKKNNRIANEAIEKLPDLAAATKNYTGAEIEGLVRGAASYALARNVDASVMKGDMKDVKVEWKDFDRALRETIPAFGSKDNEEIKGHARNGICEYGSAFEDLWNNLQKLVKLTEASSRTPLLSVLLEGAVGTGKTAVAAEMCVKSGFPFVRMISADGLIGYSEHQKCQHLLKIFNDSYKSSLSIIFIDDIERIIEFSPVGMRFSNVILQTLLVLIRRVPPKVLLLSPSSSLSSLLY
jgi:vesicle-fusing ATPase